MSDFLHQLGQRAIGASSRLRPAGPTLVSEPAPEIAADSFTARASLEAPNTPARPAPVVSSVAVASDPSRPSTPDWRPGSATRLRSDEPSDDARRVHADDLAGDRNPPAGHRPVVAPPAVPAAAVTDKLSVASAAGTDRAVRSKSPGERVRDVAGQIAPAAAAQVARVTRGTLEAVATADRRLSPPAARPAAAAPAPEVNIHIGRIELTAVVTPPPERRETPPAVKTSLDDYLRRRSGRPV